MTLFNGDHKDTKIIGTVNGKNFYLKIDTGSPVTCMNINAFETAFGKTKEKNLKEFKTDIFIRKRNNDAFRKSWKLMKTTNGSS